MIFGLRTVESDVFLKYVSDFQNAPDPTMALFQKLVFLENSIVKIDDVFVFRQRFIYDVFIKYSIIFCVGFSLAGVLLSQGWMVNLGLVCAVFNMALISPLVRYLAISLRLFVKGHRSRIELVSNSFLLDKLLTKLEDKNEERI